MTRCEPHGNLRLDPSEPFPAGNSDYCHACWRAAGGRGTAPAAPRGACALLGRPLTAEEKADRDLYSLRDWRWCGHERKPLGEAVCSCSGCGARCPGYRAGAATA